MEIVNLASERSLLRDYKTVDSGDTLQSRAALKAIKERHLDLHNTIRTLCQAHALKDVPVSKVIVPKMKINPIGEYELISGGLLIRALILNEIRLDMNLFEQGHSLFRQDELVSACLRYDKVEDLDHLFGNLFMQGYYDLMYNLNQIVCLDYDPFDSNTILKITKGGKSPLDEEFWQ